MSQKPTYAAPEWSALPTENFELEVLKEGSIVATIPLKGKAYFTLGRQHDAVDIPMDHMSISRMHAVLNFRDDGALMLRDLGSAQGTLLNKKPCEKDSYYRVYVGDLLKFGASTRQYIVSGPEEHRKPEYDSVNMEIYRDKLATRSAEIKKKLEKEEEKNVFSWGMREDAEEPEEEAEKNEEELPEYLRKMKQDEHYDRKFGDKFTANISETEAKNSKDAEIMEKIRKKERKIQNMQEENRRIYLKEGAQEDGLTGGQAAAVARNDKSIASLTDEIAHLVGQIRAKAADRGGAGDGATSGNKRTSRENDDENDVLDLSSQTADASTNWRLRKKLQKNVHLTAGGAGAVGANSAAGADGEPKALSYTDIKQQLADQNELNGRLVAQLETIEKFISSQETIVASGNSSSELQGDQIESVVAVDRIADSKATLKRLQNEQSAVAMRVSRLERLLQVATPALPSLVSRTAPPVTGEKANSATPSTVEQVSKPAQLPMNAPAPASHAQKEPAVLMGPPNRGTGSIPSTADADSDRGAADAEADKLSFLVRFIEQEKAAEEAEQKRKELEAKAAAAVAAQQAQATSSAASDISGPSASSAKKAFTPAQNTTVKGPVRGPTTRPNEDSARFDGAVLEGGEAAWVPPPKQTGDGKTSLNAKYGY
eukprot:gene21033-23874_t